MAVWLAVRRGPASGTPFGLLAEAVLVRCGQRLDTAVVAAARDRLLASGGLYWRGTRVHRRLLAGPAPAAAPAPEPEPTLW